MTETLEPALRRVAELLEIESAAVYLRDGPQLAPAAAQALTGPHTAVADRLLQLALGPLRGRGMVLIADAAGDARLRDLGAELAETGIEAAIAAPLAVAEGVIGLLALYPPAGREPSEDEWALLRAVAAQLAVALQNARLHERATALGADLEHALAAERQSARQLRSLYEISRSFAQSLSLERTLEAVAAHDRRARRRRRGRRAHARRARRAARPVGDARARRAPGRRCRAPCSSGPSP